MMLSGVSGSRRAVISPAVAGEEPCLLFSDGVEGVSKVHGGAEGGAVGVHGARAAVVTGGWRLRAYLARHPAEPRA